MALRLLLSLPLAALVFAQPVAAQEAGALSLTVNGVHSSKGTIAANLCDNPKAQFPGACATYRALAPAQQGATRLTFTGVKPGQYALQLFHDEDGNMFPSIPPEGFAYGNNQQYPPNFDKASFRVAGDTVHAVSMIYLGAAPAAAMGGKGAPAPAGVARIDLREDGLYGEFYAPAHDKPLPALIVLGGSEGGIETASRVGVGFSQHGYAVLALAYFAEPGLPKALEEAPLEYFDKALAWVKTQKKVDPKLIGVIGGSRGSEAALLMATRSADIRAVMAFAPSHAVWQGLDFSDPVNVGSAWTAGGKPLPFLTPDAAAYNPTAMKKMFDNALAAGDMPGAAIPVEKISGPILLISGKEDALWPSAEMSVRIVNRLKDKGFEHSIEHLSYDGAGHLVFIGDPSTPGARSMAKAPPNAMLGGTGEANARAWADGWPKALAFFDNALKGKSQ